MNGFPEGAAAAGQIGLRKRKGTRWRSGFLAALVVAGLALVTLLYTIINQTFGLVAVRNEVDPSQLVTDAGLPPGTALADLRKSDLVNILAAHIERNEGRRLERQQRFFSDVLIFEAQATWDDVCARTNAPAGCSLPVRDQPDVYRLVVEKVVRTDVLQTWTWSQSTFARAEIEARVAEDLPGATLEFRSWLSAAFLTNPQHPSPELAGIRTAILGSLWVLAVTVVFAFPVGVAASIYLEEYATDTWINRLIRTNINNLAGVPSIIYGMLGLAIFVRALEGLTSGGAFGLDAGGGANGRTILSAGLTLGLLILPVVIISSQEAIRAVPSTLRQAGMAVGATKWQTTRAHVLPNALPGILTGVILSVARAFGETAPLVVVGASTFITTDPTGPFSKFTTLPIQIFQWTSRPQPEFRNIAAAAIVVLLVLLLTLNATAVLFRNRFQRRY